MIERLSIQNFQAHKKLSVEFGSGITSIVGPSDVGKSAIIRALKWAAENKPAGEAFLRYGTKEVSATVTVDGRTVERSRGKGKNVYLLDGENLEAFRNDVPPEISALFNLGEINFQGQHDSPYWFCETSGEVSRRLNAIIDLSIIDRTMSALSGNLRKARAEREVREENVKRLKAERKRLRFVPRMEADWAGILEKKTEFLETAKRVAGLADVVRGVREADERQRRCVGAKRDVFLAMSAGERAAELTERVENLEIQISRFRKAEKQSNQTIPDFEGVEAAGKHWEKIVERGSSLRGILRAIKLEQDEIDEAKEDISRFDESLEQWRGQECPLCGGVI